MYKLSENDNIESLLHLLDKWAAQPDYAAMIRGRLPRDYDAVLVYIAAVND